MESNGVTRGELGEGRDEVGGGRGIGDESL